VHPNANIGLAGAARSGLAAVRRDGHWREGDVGRPCGALDAARGQDVRVRLVRSLVDDELGKPLRFRRQGLPLEDGCFLQAVSLVGPTDLVGGGGAGVFAVGLLTEREPGLGFLGSDPLEVRKCGLEV
jgi:hypothetical protein